MAELTLRLAFAGLLVSGVWTVLGKIVATMAALHWGVAQ